MRSRGDPHKAMLLCSRRAQEWVWDMTGWTGLERLSLCNIVHPDLLFYLSGIPRASIQPARLKVLDLSGSSTPDNVLGYLIGDLPSISCCVLHSYTCLPTRASYFNMHPFPLECHHWQLLRESERQPVS